METIDIPSFEIKYTLKLFNLLEQWTDVSNIDFRDEMMFDLKKEIEKVNPPIVTPNCLFRSIKLPNNLSCILESKNILYQPQLTSWTNNQQLAYNFRGPNWYLQNATHLIVKHKPQKQDVLLDFPSLSNDPSFSHDFLVFKNYLINKGSNIEYYILDKNKKCREQEFIINTSNLSTVEIESINFKSITSIALDESHVLTPYPNIVTTSSFI